jgi:hypothetical protein
MRGEYYYTIEAKAVFNHFNLVGYEPNGVWVLSGNDLLFKFLPGNEKAEWAAKQALIRADQMFGEKRGMDHLRYIRATAGSYSSNHTAINKTKKFTSANSCIESLLAGLPRLRYESQDWRCSLLSCFVDGCSDR